MLVHIYYQRFLYSLHVTLCSHVQLYLNLKCIFIINSVVVNVGMSVIYLPKSDVLVNLSSEIDEI